MLKAPKNLNGEGGSDFALGQQDMEKAGKISLGDLLKKYYSGFGLGLPRNPFLYRVGPARLHLIIDGIDVDYLNPDPLDLANYAQFFKQFLDYYKAEDIKGIEIMKSDKYALRYAERFLSHYDPAADYFFVEVTTYGGSGPFLKKTPGFYLYKPPAFAQQQQFYVPRYTAKNDELLLDTRSTIYWSANIITSKDGKARISFYTADKQGTYTLLIDGCDMNGNLESIWKKIRIK